MVKEWAYQKDENSPKANYLSVDYNANALHVCECVSKSTTGNNFFEKTA
jgi:hypothetical protein